MIPVRPSDGVEDGTIRHSGLIAAAVACAMAGCSQPTPQDAERAREGLPERAAEQPDTIPDLIEPRVPPAAPGDSGWAYAERTPVDLDGDGKSESIVLISDVTLDKRGVPLWEDGQRWQLYVEDAKGKRTRLYARFVPNGKVTVRVARPVAGSLPTIVLLQEAADRMTVYEFRYRDGGAVDVWNRLDRPVMH